jgi:AcrR family transcriptional regulator
MTSKASVKVLKSVGSTPEKILQAARLLFVEHGFSGTSMGQIAAKAGVNHSLLFHHFGNKQKLWLEVKEAILNEGKLIYSTLPSLDLPLETFLEELIRHATLFYKNNPDIVRVINWQRLENGTEQKIGLTLSKESLAWINACKHYQEKGDIDLALKPEFIITFVLAIVGSIAMDPNIFIQDSDSNKLYIKFCAERLHQALRLEKRE